MNTEFWLKLAHIFNGLIFFCILKKEEQQVLYKVKNLHYIYTIHHIYTSIHCINVPLMQRWRWTETWLWKIFIGETVVQVCATRNVEMRQRAYTRWKNTNIFAILINQNFTKCYFTKCCVFYLCIGHSLNSWTWWSLWVFSNSKYSLNIL